MTLRIIITRQNLEEKKELGNIHSNVFPDIFTETCNIILRQDNKLYHEHSLEMNERVNFHDFIMPLQQVGEFKFSIEILCTAYKGFDQSLNFSYKVGDKSELREVFL